MFRSRCGFRRKVVFLTSQSSLLCCFHVLFSCVVTCFLRFPDSVAFPSLSLLSRQLHNFYSIPSTSSSVRACPGREAFQIGFEGSQRLDCSSLLEPYEGLHALTCYCLLWGSVLSALSDALLSLTYMLIPCRFCGCWQFVLTCLYLEFMQIPCHLVLLCCPWVFSFPI